MVFSLALAGLTVAVPINVAFHWHMHQPIYYPYESVVDTVAAKRFDYSVLDVFTSRSGPYNDWPATAVSNAQALGGSCGAQVSFTGALSENLVNLQKSSLTSVFANFQQPWQKAHALKTAKGNPALYLTAFGYHHPLMPLTDPALITMQILLHRISLQQRFGIKDSPDGLFPPENCFSPRMIPALVEAGIRWVLVDNIHFDRAHAQYPWSAGATGNLYPPNPADQRNKQNTTWMQLNDLWCGSKVSVPFGYRPYWVEYVDPATGKASRIIAVPGARYEGNEDGRGGFGALNYEKVMSQYLQYNKNSTRPMLTVLAHDGDNYGGGTDSYYKSNFDNFLKWVKSASDYSCTTIDDYLANYPVPQSEVIHVEDGSWSGANNGDPQFMKWNPNFFAAGYEPERNSWAVLTAGTNVVLTANQMAPLTSLESVLNPTSGSSDTDWALHYFLCSQASDYEYWPGIQVWDSDPTRGTNLAATYALKVITGSKRDTTPPTIFLPQRQYWNPGSVNWDVKKPDPADFGIWTHVYDVNTASKVTLHLRITQGKQVATAENLVYNGGQWKLITMTKVPLVGPLAPTTDPKPTVIADMYQATVVGVRDALVDYYVSAEDSLGNLAQSPLQSVYVGKGNSTYAPQPL